MIRLCSTQKILLLSILLTIPYIHVFADTDENKITAPENYKIVYTEIEGPTQFGKRWQELIKSEISALDKHYISEKEWNALMDQKYITVKNKLLKNFETLQEELAEMQLRQRSEQTGKKYDIFLKLQKIKKQLAHLENKSKIKLVDSLSIQHTDMKNIFTENLLYIHPETSLWIYGKSSLLRPGVYSIEYHALNANTNEKVLIVQKTFNENDILKIVDLAIVKIRTIILNRSWSSLTLKSNISTSKYYLGDKEVKNHKVLETLRPGSYELKIKTPGHEDETQILDLKPYKSLTLEFKPLILPNNTHFIDSNPQGAQVFLDGFYIGKTPLNITASKNQILHINHPEYQTTYATITQEDNLFFTLVHKDYDMELSKKKIKKSQTIFYTSFGLFAASLILPITMYSFYNDFSDRSNRLEKQGNVLESRNAKITSNNYGFALIGTVSLSAGLFSWSIFQLIQYTKTSSK